MNPPLPSDLTSAPAPSISAPPSVARWRWWVFLLFIGSAPLWAALSAIQGENEAGPMLPKTVSRLLLFCAVQMAAFGVVWAIAWAFSRADKDQLFLRWRDGWKPLAWGALYSLALRAGIMAVMIVVVLWLVMLGFKAEQLVKILQNDQPEIRKLLLPALLHNDPLYRFLLITLISFVVAGLREELWRAATLAGLLHLAPQNWNHSTKNGVALGVSSAVFGMGHLYQGWVGVVLTGILGIGLGAITLRHRSVWPAVFAHGFFDAATFVALAMSGSPSGPR